MGMSRRSLFWSKVGGTDSNHSRVGAATGEGALWQLSGSFPEAGQQVFAKPGCSETFKQHSEISDMKRLLVTSWPNSTMIIMHGVLKSHQKCQLWHIPCTLGLAGVGVVSRVFLSVYTYSSSNCPSKTIPSSYSALACYKAITNHATIA